MTSKRQPKHTLLMLHGITATKDSIGKSAEVYRLGLGADEVVAPDLPFHAQGEQLPGFDVPDMLAWFDGIVQGLLDQSERLTIIGHSYSAVILLYWAAGQSRPLPGLKLIAVAPPLRVTRTARQFAKVLDLLPKWLSWYTFAGPRVKPIIQAYLSTYPRRQPDRGRIFASTKLDDNSLERYKVQLKMNNRLYKYMRANPLPPVNAPTLLMLFEKDLVVDSVRLAEHLNTELQARITVQYVPRAGHLLISQDPERMVRLIAGQEEAERGESVQTAARREDAIRP